MKRSKLALAAAALFAAAGAATGHPLRLDYCVEDLGGGSFRYTFRYVLDNNDNSWAPGQGWRWFIFGDQNQAASPLTNFVGDPASLPVGPWTGYTSSGGGHNGPTFNSVLDYWIPSAVGETLTWQGTSTADLQQGQMLYSNIAGTLGGALAPDFAVANRLPSCTGQPTGACCRPDGSCVVTTATSCSAANGIYRGDGTTCPANCPQPATGACCRFDGSCSIVSQAACSAANGTYRGDGSTCAAPCPTPPPVIFGNCNLGTGATTLSGVGGLPAGEQWSEVARDAADPTTANTTAGFGGTGALRLADDFVVPAGGMNIAYIRFPVYLTGATSVTCTALTLQILNGPPNAGGTPVFGDPTTNRLANAQFAPYYRTFNTVTPPTCGGATTPPGTTRHIQWAYAAVNQTLPAGTYWLDWNYTGASFSPSSTAATAIGRQCNPNNANALQFNAAWGPCNDIGQGCAATPVQQDMYFEILGTPGGPICYPDCNGDHALNVNDFICFQGAFAGNNLPLADCNHDTVLNVNDFICFQSAFAAGCSQL